MDSLESIVEPNLGDAFYDFFETLEEENQDLEIVNDESPKIDLEVLDFM